jgi:CheY-like chemotaxis protein
MIGYAELVAVSLGRESKVRERLDGIVQAGMRAKDLIQQILTFSRQNTHDRKPVQPGGIVDEAMRLLRPALPTTIEIQKSIQSRAFVEGDATQIHQIVFNLCTNAYHAMKAAGGLLKVSAEDVVLREGIEQEGWVLQPGGYVVIRVSDTGEGIPADIRKRIFEPYFTTREKGEGTGLGLATVHGILKSHCGGLLLESEIGKGTTFHVYLPVLEGVEPSSDERIVVGSLTGTERILFVDDEAAIIEIASEALEELGYHVTAKNDPSEALECFRSNAREFDIVITDLTMPKMTGIQMVREMKKIREDIPIILCTGYRQLVETEDIHSAGISSVVAKPATSSDLAQALRRLMDSRKISDHGTLLPQ